jgi:hypothetical protein
VNVRSFLLPSLVGIALAVALPALAQRPANAPKDATAQCVDGTYSAVSTQSAACAEHGGVKTWWGAETASMAKGSTTPRCEDSRYLVGQSLDWRLRGILLPRVCR